MSLRVLILWFFPQKNPPPSPGPLRPPLVRFVCRSDSPFFWEGFLLLHPPQYFSPMIRFWPFQGTKPSPLWEFFAALRESYFFLLYSFFSLSKPQHGLYLRVTAAPFFFCRKNSFFHPLASPVVTQSVHTFSLLFIPSIFVTLLESSLASWKYPPNYSFFP